MTPRFSLGRVVATPGVLRAFEVAGDSPAHFILGHESGDWGIVDAHDQRANERALTDGSRIWSAFKLRDGTKIYIITTAQDDDGNRESTCVLLPDEY